MSTLTRFSVVGDFLSKTASLSTATDNHHDVPIPALVKNNRARLAQGADAPNDIITLLESYESKVVFRYCLYINIILLKMKEISTPNGIIP